MTTITIERDKVERWLSALEVATRFVYQDNRPECEAAVEDLRTALAAPATAPEFPANWAQMIHYPECWDTAAYPELRYAIHEALAWSGCSVCKPSTAPAWHDAQQAEIESLRWTVKDALESLDNGMTADCRATLSSATKETP